MRCADAVLAMRIAEGSAGYGVYCMLLEMMRDAESRTLVNNPRNLAFAMNEPDAELVARVIREYGLFEPCDDSRIRSPWLELVMGEFDAKKQAASEAGRKGAMARYGKAMGGAMATPQQPDSNTPTEIQNNAQNTSSQPRSQLLQLSWGGMDGSKFFDLARGSREPLSDADKQHVYERMCAYAEQGDDQHDIQSVYTLCDLLRVSSKVFYFLISLTSNGQKGTAVMRRLYEIISDVRGGKIKIKYPNDYVLTQLVPLA